MVDALLAYSRVEQADDTFERIECNAVLDRVMNDLQIRIEENDAEIVVDSLPPVIADGEQLKQLFATFVSNAIKYNESETPRVEITAEERTDHWEFSVADNGIGIDPGQTDRFFEVFKRPQNDGECSGTGIGLSLYQEIVSDHGGDIRVDGEPGEGSAFTFTLSKRTGD